MSRYAITSLGPAEKLGAAAVPFPGKTAQGYQSRGIIDGQPGTQPIPAPGAGLPQDNTALAQNAGWHRSSQVNNVWYPALYYERPGDQGYEHAPVSILSDNQMPLPAINPLGPPAAGARQNAPASQSSVPPWVAQGRPRLGGQFQVVNRASVPAYPSLGGNG